jgi:hypothetical protein
MKVQSEFLLLCVLAAGPALADEPLKLVSASFMDVDAQLKTAQGHPNEEWRLNGLKSYQSGRYDEAVGRFERAAGYADKYSQHYLSLIYWHGQGVPADRVRGYIWADLAAERGSRKLLAIREKMWAELTAQERDQAVRDGVRYYDLYGDAITKPRAEAEIRRFARGMTGSRIGYRNQNIDITQGGPIHGSFGNATAGMLAASSSVVGTTDEQRFYHDDRTTMDPYWQAQDVGLERGGRVDVGPVAMDRKPR